jgi:hypothetical protein
MASKSIIEMRLELHRLLTGWLEQSLAIQKFCDERGMQLPVELRLVFSENGASHSKDSAAPNVVRGKRGPYKERDKSLPRRNKFEFTIPSPPDYGPRPPGIGPDAKAPLLAEVTAPVLLLYIIKQEGGAASSATINAKLPILRPASATSTASMALYTLKDEDKIAGDSRLWTLKQDVEIAISGQRMWCGLELLRQGDRAALRREVIVAALKVNPRMTVGGLSECLRACDWLNGVAAEPDMVKGDVRILEKTDFIERDGAFWKLKA